MYNMYSKMYSMYSIRETLPLIQITLHLRTQVSRDSTVMPTLVFDDTLIKRRRLTAPRPNLSTSSWIALDQ